MRTVLVGNRRLMRHLLAAMLRADWDVVGILGAAGTSAAARHAKADSAAQLGAAHDIPVHETADINGVATRLRAEQHGSAVPWHPAGSVFTGTGRTADGAPSHTTVTGGHQGDGDWK